MGSGDKAFGRYSGLGEVKRAGPHKGIRALIKRKRHQSAPQCEDTARGQAMCEPEPNCQHPDLGLPALRTVRNKFLSPKSSSLWYFLMLPGTDK